MTQIITPETIVPPAQYDHKAALRVIDASKKAFESIVLEQANASADNIIDCGGTTRSIGQFTLAMFGYDGSVGLVDHQIEEFVDVQNSIGANNYSMPVAKFDKRPDKPKLSQIGFMHSNNTQSPLSFRVSRSELSGSYIGDVNIQLCSVRADNLKTPNITDGDYIPLTLLSVRRNNKALEAKWHKDSLIVWGWQKIYETQQLGSTSSKWYAEDDARFLQLVQNARGSDGCLHH